MELIEELPRRLPSEIGLAPVDEVDRNIPVRFDLNGCDLIHVIRPDTLFSLDGDEFHLDCLS